MVLFPEFSCYVLLFDEITTVSVGVMIWWRTLRERALFATYWDNGSSSFRSMLESDFNCCGYYTCSADPSSTNVCVDAIQDYADKILNQLFTSVFASTIFIVLFYLCTLCVIAEIKLLNRYRLIDIRQGNASFRSLYSSLNQESK
ncbi:tetraspanin Pls1 family [Pyrrhoderma noxium]|uniref:Tetraspanin Pls1 family n=1 Tax=Pyrrhoderma noxium TaxID=2282107 RepID=A0A286UIU7_9AGAM|nr:tetraspanin Pls1 family [Pyrrhoderma noxium]